MPATPLIGQLMLFGGNFAPQGWMTCNGQLLPISQYDALFAVIGTTFGGDGQSTFVLPDLRGRVPLHGGPGPGLTNRPLGQTVGSENVTLGVNEMPAHAHPAFASDLTGTSPSPAGNLWARGRAANGYAGNPGAQMSPQAIASAGGGQPHTNLQPHLAMNYCIATEGIFPSGSGDIQQFIAEVILFAGNLVPNAWARCDGQLLPIAQNQALFSLVGTTYGGNGVSNFALPDLRARAPMHAGSGPGLTPRTLGSPAGSEGSTLLSSQIPNHIHTAQGRPTEGQSNDPAGRVWAKRARGEPSFIPPAGAGPLVMLNAGALSSTGGSQPHQNMQPSLAINFLIALFGIFPSRN